jgi:hypothetical protein
MVINEPKQVAAETAIMRCRTFKARAAAERCKVVATFSRECFAVAYDPQPGTPGAGWGIGPDQDTANRKAIAMCEETAGPGRKGFCKVETGGCDGAGEATPGVDQDWADLRRTLSRQEGQFNWDVPVLLLLGGTIAGVAYVVGRSLKKNAGPSLDKRSKGKVPAGKPAKGKANRSVP